MRRLQAALAFLTILPLGPPGRLEASTLGHSMAYFPAIGLLLGGLLVGTRALLLLIWPESVADLLLIGLLVILTGGLHLDGLADTVDGLMIRANCRPMAEALQTMREGTVGAIGAAAVALVLGLKYAALYALPIELKPVGLLLMPVAGRWTMVPATFWSRYARGSGPGLARAYIDEVRLPDVAVASLIAATAAGLSLGWRGIWILGILVVGVGLFCRASERAFGGMTGDTLGALNEAAEVCFLLLLLLVKMGSG